MASQSKGKAQYAKPATQVDLEERLANGNASFKVLSTAENAPVPDPDEVAGQSYAVEGNELDGYIGTSPEYMTYANDTEKPGVGEDNVEEDVAEFFLERMENAQPEKEDVEAEEPEEPEAPEEPNSGSTQPQA